MKKYCMKCGKIHDVKEKCQIDTKRVSTRNPLLDDHYFEFLSTMEWRRKRKEIKIRDNGICLRCYFKFNKINTRDLQCHHIKPRSIYPELELDDSNLITLCKSCNTQIGTAEELDFELPVDYLRKSEEERQGPSI